MCVSLLTVYQCSICADIAAKPKIIVRRCHKTPDKVPHCGVLKPFRVRPESVPQLAQDLHPTHPDYISGEALEKLQEEAKEAELNAYRLPKPTTYQCELCIEHLGRDEATARSKWVRKELKQQLTMRQGGYLTGGYSTAGWKTTLR